ncbi:glycoside hydrolase family 31 protein [Rutstroemia sp. NJR-2017a WRK4]|nr:glycoside hydrolase family 31 protein [Rutstroemia sp. NJR-2017a WRK4]
MKFTHGVWFKQENCTIHNAVEITDITIPSPGVLRALCTIQHVAHRGDTLNKPTITLQVTAPARDIISCKAEHFRGAKNTDPRFTLFPDVGTEANKIDVRIENVEQKNITSLSCGALSAELNASPKQFNLAYRSSQTGRLLTELAFESVQYIIAPPEHGIPLPLKASTAIADPYYRRPEQKGRCAYISLSFSLQVGEYVYGLGERFGPLVKNGQEIDLWNEDAGTCTPYAYKNIPFYMTNRGYGVFFDHSDLVSLEIQTERLGRVNVAVQGEEIRWYIIHGSTPKERYTLLTGRPALPPPWSFGLYLSTSFLTDYDEKTVTAQLDGMAERGIPMSVLHFDCFWMKAHQWTDFTFDPQYFPDPKGFLRRLHERGLKVCVWINAYIAQNSDVFEDAMEHGYLIKRLDGSVWQSDIWQAGMGIVDFTNPDALNWYQEHLFRLLDIGVDSFKTDFGERIPWEDVQFFNGMNPRAGHNYYSYLYNKTVYDAIATKRGRDEAVLFARAATAGGQQFPVHWGGDCECTWQGMSQSLHGGLSLGLSGFGFWSHDIGGFMSEGQAPTTPEATLYKRWVQFGMLSSHSRLHGSATYRVPWLIDDEACDVLRKFTRLKNKLMPYIYLKAIEAHNTGVPLLRAMFLEFPQDRTCQTLDNQYMLGDSLLVAPIFDDEGIVEYYVPAGKWRGLLDGKLRTGPAWITEQFDNLHLPVLLREDRVLLVDKEERPDYDWTSSITQVVVGEVTQKLLEVDVPSSQKLGDVAAHVKVQIDDIEQKAGSVIEGVDGSIQVEFLSESFHL